MDESIWNSAEHDWDFAIHEGKCEGLMVVDVSVSLKGEPMMLHFNVGLDPNILTQRSRRVARKTFADIGEAVYRLIKEKKSGVHP